MRLLLDLGGDEPPKELVISEKSLRQVRANFNPSGFGNVDRAKLLCAALITEAEHAASAKDAQDEARRCSAIARTHIETGAMYIVKALTTPPPEPPTTAPQNAQQPA